jgi:hypothetical protein
MCATLTLVLNQLNAPKESKQSDLASNENHDATFLCDILKKYERFCDNFLSKSWIQDVLLILLFI